MTLSIEYVRTKSAPKLAGLIPVVRAAAEALIDRCYMRGVPIVITQGLRTIAEQDALYAQGRTKPGAIVTKAKGGYSFHNFGVAIDFALLMPDGKAVSWDMKRDGDRDGKADWYEVVEEAKALGFEWGGDWTSFRDYPHFQMTLGLTCAQYRAGKRPSQVQIDAATVRIEKLKGADEPEMNHEKATVKVDGKPAKDGVIIDGSVYVPLRDISERIGASITWDNKAKLATITTKEAK